MAVADLTIPQIAVAVSEAQASALVVASSELILMPARYLFQMLKPRKWRAVAMWRAAINAVLTTLVELSGATRLKSVSSPAKCSSNSSAHAACLYSLSFSHSSHTSISSCT